MPPFPANPLAGALLSGRVLGEMWGWAALAGDHPGLSSAVLIILQTGPRREMVPGRRVSAGRGGEMFALYALLTRYARAETATADLVLLDRHVGGWR